MSAKSLGTLPVIYAADEQQNSLPRKTILCIGDTNSTGWENGIFPRSLGLRLSIQHCIKGEGAHNCYFCSEKGRGWKIPTTAWVFQLLLADIVIACVANSEEQSQRRQHHSSLSNSY